jgi:Fur family transcriptional regulator, zinc uptake regulator
MKCYCVTYPIVKHKDFNNLTQDWPTNLKTAVGGAWLRLLILVSTQRDHLKMLQSCFPEANHNHESCKHSILETAEKRCRENGVRFTQQRRQVLEILAESHQAMGAYEILDRFKPKSKGRTAPVTIYRALDFLIENNLAHRLNSLNAFVACSGPHDLQGVQFLVCKMCQTVAELSTPSIYEAIEKETQSADFTMTTPMVEIRGICRGCKG